MNQNILKTIPFVLAAFAVAAGLLWYVNILPGGQSQQKTADVVRGNITEILLNERVMTIQDDTGYEIDVALLPTTVLYSETGRVVDLYYFRPGVDVVARGTQNGNGLFTAQTISISDR